MNNNQNKDGLKRVFSLIWKNYKLQVVIIVFLILFSALANVLGSTFLQTLIDQYITPLSGQSNPDFSGLLKAIAGMAGIYLAGILSTWIWNRLMVNISLGTLNDVREGLFRHMETLPVSYFDTHAHGDIMSIYTNDTDTLRQLISQSAPQVLSSGAQIVFVLVSMFVMNWQLALVTVIMGGVMLYASRFISSRSGRFFREQQKQLGAVNGFIEEMMEGQRVIKVFTHEEKSIQDFEAVNDKLCDASTNANKFANILMPICMNIGYISYVLTALTGAIFALNGMFGITLGTIAAFLQL
ncbi:ABC transporter permease, partial [Faecalibaculum rodentium]